MIYIVLGIIIVLLSYFLFYAWNKSQSTKFKKLINIRNSIARDLHDDVGATLSSISFYTDAAKQRIQQEKYEEALSILNEMGLSARTSIENMSDIVWMVNPKNDSFEFLFIKIEDYAKQMCASNNIEIEYINNVQYLQKIDLLKRRDIFLICKESINNAVKYSKATKLFVKLLIENGVLKISIVDNGIGFDIENTKEGNGLLNLKVRANALNAEIKISSKLNLGTEILLNVPLKDLNN